MSKTYDGGEEISESKSKYKNFNILWNGTNGEINKRVNFSMKSRWNFSMKIKK